MPGVTQPKLYRMKNTLAAVAIACCVIPAAAASSDWPEFRGPTCDGHAPTAPGGKPIGLPLHWSETENIKWKTPIPFRGWSTPVVMGDQVWLTTATMDGHDFYAICVDTESGKIRFNEKVFHCEKPEPLGNDVNCYATPSAVLEPGRRSEEHTSELQSQFHL